jgi:predicted TIM-barrel fold metal-dependent hydrolase
VIIDAHAHLGYDQIFEEEFNAENLLINMDKYKITASIVQPGVVLNLEEVIVQHNNIASLSEKASGRIFGMANPNPHLSKEKYQEELERCIKKLGFVGVKINPLAHAVNPTNLASMKVFEIASELEIPVMVHTGSGVPWALPSLLIPIAKGFPDLKIILAHCGGPLFSSEAELAAKICPNIYLETSWLPGTTIYHYCKTLGAHRVMFGSDHAENIATELTKYRTIGLSNKELRWCLWKTASSVFNISTD